MVQKQELQVGIGSAKIDQVVLLSAQFLTDAILGLDFHVNYKAKISFPERRKTLRVNVEV
jgi:hypothetical protein